MGAIDILFLCYQGSGTSFHFRKMALVTGRRQIKGAQISSKQWHPELASAPPFIFLPQLSPFQLTLAPRILPNTLISVDFAANYLTKIYGLTFGQKPNLRSEVRGGPWAEAGEVGGAEAEAATLSETEKIQTSSGRGPCHAVWA